MVARDPISSWTLRKFSATIIGDVWPEVLLFTIIATAVVVVSGNTDVKLGVSNQLLTVLGFVLALVISFRTSSAYERYQEGKEMWTNISIASRNLAMMIWIHVPNERHAPAPEQSVLQSIIEKKTMINLIHAFVVSVKHCLREEQGVYYEDLYPLVSFLPRYATTTGTEGADADRLPLWHVRNESNHPVDRTPTSQESSSTRPIGHVSRGTSYSTILDNKQQAQVPPFPSVTPDLEASLPLPTISDHPLKPARNPPPVTVYDYIPAFSLIRWLIRHMLHRANPDGKKRKKRQGNVESHIPLEISLVLSNYSGWLMWSELVEPAIATGMTTNLASLQDTVLNLERICNTPLPFAYQVHLRMSLWLYLTFLPFQIYLAYGVITIPATAFAAFLLLGFLEIGQEIENPFNYDENDLDLDFFCLLIQRDLYEITAHPNSNPSTYIFTKWNQPFAPADLRSAEELTRDNVPYRSPNDGTDSEPETNSIRRTLVNAWKTVDNLTREK
ncbi:UPF0187-domain-containing protein [Phlegmacium glaucopus]|nr:UPF0187-domain-containing protein [Phlegmacium glaucopus]